MRPGARMSGAFCLHRQINPGEFICAWNGRQILDADNVERLINIYDLTKYALSFPTGRKKELLYSAPRLDKFGRPLPLPERASDVGDPRDVSLAVFLNEPSPEHVAVYDPSTDVVRVVPKARNSANVCLRTEKQRNGIVCPLMFASRIIRPGEELTWDYGATDYDRRFYEIDEDKGIFNVSDDKYSATEASTNMCKITCETVEFKHGLAIEPFTPNLFLLDAELLTPAERQRIEFRSDKYLPDRNALDDSSVDTLSIGDVSNPDTSAARPTKRRRRRQSLQRRTITVESMQQEELANLTRGQRDLDGLANGILHRLNAVKPGRIRDPTKLRIIAILKNVIQPALYLPYEERTERGHTIVHHFPRTDFVLTRASGETFIKEDDDVMWKDILKMQHMVFLQVDSIIDALKNTKESDKIHLKFTPNKYTSIFLRPDGTRETTDDWDNPVFQAEHPTAHRVGKQFLRKLEHIEDTIKHYDKWHRMLEAFDAEHNKRSLEETGRRQSDEDLMWQKGRRFIEVALNMLHENAYEQIHDLAFRELSFAGMEALLASVKKRPLDPRRASTSLNALRTRLDELRSHGSEKNTSLATEMLHALHAPNMWRSECLLASLGDSCKRDP